MGNKISIGKISRDLKLNQITYRMEQVLVDQVPEPKDKRKRSHGMEVNPKETMTMLLGLQVLPDDHNATLNAYLRKLAAFKDYQARIPFAITQTVIHTQLKRLSGLKKTIMHITAPRLTYGCRVDNVPAPVDNTMTVGIPLEGHDCHEPPSSPWNETNPSLDKKQYTDDEQDRQYPKGLGGNL
jgi:hypothetical protein